MPPSDAGASPSYSEGYRSKFMAVFDKLVQELTAESLKNPDISPGIQRLEEVRFTLCHLYMYQIEIEYIGEQ